MSYISMGDIVGALIYIAIFGGVCAIILKTRGHNPGWGIPLGIIGPIGIVIAIGIAFALPRDQDDDGPGGFSR